MMYQLPMIVTGQELTEALLERKLLVTERVLKLIANVVYLTWIELIIYQS